MSAYSLLLSFSLSQFVCIAQQDYCCILNQVEKNMQKVEEEGEIVMVKEHRELDRTGTRKGHIVIKVRTQLRTSVASLCFSNPEENKCSEIFTKKLPGLMMKMYLWEPFCKMLNA